MMQQEPPKMHQPTPKKFSAASVRYNPTNRFDFNGPATPQVDTSEFEESSTEKEVGGRVSDPCPRFRRARTSLLEEAEAMKSSLTSAGELTRGSSKVAASPKKNSFLALKKVSSVSMASETGSNYFYPFLKKSS
mmetsp:Transcript_382/g.1115  ORF Transcript_382/g.1115 Transcript_382/m.1115 type:complete len:134 (+) Transcript_382:160-561(+)